MNISAHHPFCCQAHYTNHKYQHTTKVYVISLPTRPALMLIILPTLKQNIASRTLILNRFKIKIAQCLTRHKNKAGRAFAMIGKLKNINRLRADNFVGFTPAQFLWRNRCT